jgi:hypothetical protein
MADSRQTPGAPNDPSTKEKAEGSRDNVNVEDIQHDDPGEAGISNRPIEEEQREQQNLPPRGRSKEGGHA